jgi:hypothetical protein
MLRECLKSHFGTVVRYPGRQSGLHTVELSSLTRMSEWRSVGEGLLVSWGVPSASLRSQKHTHTRTRLAAAKQARDPVRPASPFRTVLALLFSAGPRSHTALRRGSEEDLITGAMNRPMKRARVLVAGDGDPRAPTALIHACFYSP